MTTHRSTRSRDDAGRISRSRAAGTALRLGALVLFVGAAACTPAIPRGPSVAPTPRGGTSWVVEPGDIVRLKNWGAPEQSGDLVVNERGTVLIPTVGHVTVQGVTPDSLERRIVRAFSGRVDPARVDVQLFRPITVTGGVRDPGVHLVDAPTSVLSIVARSGGAIRPGGDSRMFVVRPGESTREISVADRIGDLGMRASDQLYVQDPPFAVRNEMQLRSAYSLVQLAGTLVTIFILVRQN